MKKADELLSTAVQPEQHHCRWKGESDICCLKQRPHSVKSSKLNTTYLLSWGKKHRRCGKCCSTYSPQTPGAALNTLTCRRAFMPDFIYLFIYFSSQLQIPLTNKSCSLPFQLYLVYLLRLSYSLQKFCKQLNITQPSPSTAHQCRQMLVGSPEQSQAVG